MKEKRKEKEKMSKEEATTNTPPPPPPPPSSDSTTTSTSVSGTEKEVSIREEIVENAVNFLRNPNVAGTPLARRVAFMKRKGMTSKEIDTALARAAAAGTGGASSQAMGPASPVPPTLPPRAQMYGGIQQPMPPPQQPLMMPPQQNGVGWVPLIGASVLAAGLGVGASYLVSKYVIPWWKGDSKEKEKEKKKGEKEKEEGRGEEEDVEDKELKEMLKSIDENQKNMIKSINELSQAIRDGSN